MTKSRDNISQKYTMEDDDNDVARRLAGRYISGFSHIAEGYVFVENSNKQLTKNFSYFVFYYKEKDIGKKGIKITYKPFNSVNMLLPSDGLFSHIDRRILFSNGQMRKITQEITALLGTLDECCRDKLSGYEIEVTNDDYFSHDFFSPGKRISNIYQMQCSSDLMITESGIFHTFNFIFTYARNPSSMGITFYFSLMKKNNRLYLYDCDKDLYQLTSYSSLNEKLLESNRSSFYYMFKDLGIQTQPLPDIDEIKKNLPLVSIINF